MVVRAGSSTVAPPPAHELSAGVADVDPFAAEQRERLLRALEEEVLIHGYTETTVADVVLRAGMSTKTFYKHFDDKQTAFRAALLPRATEVLTITRASSQSVRPWPARVATSLQALLGFLTENPQIAQLGIVEIQAAGPQALAEFHHWLRRYADSLAPRTSEISTHMGTRPGLADQIAGAISQLLYDKITAGEPEQLPKLLPDLIDICLAPYIGPRQAEAALTSLKKRI